MANQLALDVTQNGVKMLVLLDVKRFEAALIKRPGAGAMIMGMPALCVRPG